jgi:hypothetical protein
MGERSPIREYAGKASQRSAKVADEKKSNFRSWFQRNRLVAYSALTAASLMGLNLPFLVGVMYDLQLWKSKK